MPLRAWSSSRFTIDLPPGHRFPIAKYAAIRDRVAQRGILPAEAILEPDRADRWALALVHTSDYLDKVHHGTLSRAEERRLGFPWSETQFLFRHWLGESE
jgi:acetoin utilization deacetylase AcuC-like enzyme